MKVAIPIHGERISSVFDSARCFLLLSFTRGGELIRNEVTIDFVDPVDKAKGIVDLGARVLICGAISRSPELLLISSGVRLIPNTCGLVEEVFAAFVSDKLTDRAFLMPGCAGQGRLRRKHCRRGWNRWKR